MNTELKLSKFAKYACFVLAYNVVVILWGVFLRASKSGDGCGRHWLTCNGEIIPAAAQFKTIIEFSHRVTSSMAGLFILILLVWTLTDWYSGKSERKGFLLKAVVGSFIFVIFEGLIGAGLVLTGNTAETLTAARPFWMAAHLVNTLILLMFLTLTAWFASGGERLNFRANPKISALLSLGVLGMFFIGISGSIAALSSMLFSSATLAESVARDFSETSHVLLRLRILHPISSVAVGVFLLFLAGWLKSKTRENPSVNRWASVLSVLVLVQFIWGAMTLLTLAPIVMQLGHLLLADLVWIAFILLSANVLAEENAVEKKFYTAKKQCAAA
ncbi:MAG TPA: COX15/CtaA family protein [Pyrinomonadaceae bacterium]|nr:COX15/CtaA family protein [Pyrinomonadaceae bacterium]